MRSLAILVVCLASCTVGLIGCGGPSTGTGEAPAQSELDQYLQDNPDVAAEETPEMVDEDE